MSTKMYFDSGIFTIRPFSNHVWEQSLDTERLRKVISIIIVDDEEFITASLSRFIAEYHPEYKVAGTFSNVQEAISFLRKKPIDVIISDIRMPGTDGLEMIRQIREFLPKAEILIISGYSEFEYAQKACAYRVTNYLLKPIDRKELSSNLKNIAERFKKLLPNSNHEDDETQMVFIDLLCRVISDKQELHRRFDELELSTQSADWKGCFLSVTLKDDTLHLLTRTVDDISAAMLNGIRSQLSQYISIYLFRHHMNFYFVLLSSQALPFFSVQSLSDSLSKILGHLCSAKTITVFDSLDDLLTTQEMPVHAVDSDIESDQVIKHAKDFIRAHYADNLSREDVANAVYLDGAYFSRLFKQKAGMSFISYLTQVRMEKAVELLATQMSTTEIASAVGYLHRNRFITNFKEYSGYTPNEYRKKFLMGEGQNGK